DGVDLGDLDVLAPERGDCRVHGLGDALAAHRLPGACPPCVSKCRHKSPSVSSYQLPASSYQLPAERSSLDRCRESAPDREKLEGSELVAAFLPACRRA